jgi:hypothetical protein
MDLWNISPLELHTIYILHSSPHYLSKVSYKFVKVSFTAVFNLNLTHLHCKKRLMIFPSPVGENLVTSRLGTGKSTTFLHCIFVIFIQYYYNLICLHRSRTPPVSGVSWAAGCPFCLRQMAARGRRVPARRCGSCRTLMRPRRGPGGSAASAIWSGPTACTKEILRGELAFL